MRFAVLSVLALAGCDQIFAIDTTQLQDADTRPDLDHDGIADVIDPCIAPSGDGDEDLDMDGIPNATDRCPLAPDPNDPDSDGDGVGDPCDPFPTLPGDTLRCLMAFSSRDLNATLWAPRPGESEFATGTNLLIALGPGSAIALEGVLPAAPTIEVNTAIGTAFSDRAFQFGIWISAGSESSSKDVACLVSYDGMTPALAISVKGPGPPSPVFGAPPTSAGFFLRAIIEPDVAGTNLICALAYSGGFIFTRGHVDVPLGSFGFLSGAGVNGVEMATMMTRDDQPALP